MAASINIVESDIHFNDTIHFTYSYDRTLRSDEVLQAYASCTDGQSVVWAQFALVSRGDDNFYLGPTPSWSGGAAEGTVVLQVVRNGGRRRVVAQDTFSVQP